MLTGTTFSPPPQRGLYQMLGDLAPYVRRLLGWEDDGVAARALESIGLCLGRRTALTLIGSTDMVPVASRIHSTAHPEAPFVLVDNRRGDRDRDFRSPRSTRTLGAALRTADGGTVCIRAERMPPDWQANRYRLADRNVVLMIAAPTNRLLLRNPALARPAPVVVPPIGLRSEPDIARIVSETIEEIRADLKIAEGLPTPHVEWISRTATSVHRVEVTVRRLLVALTSPNLADAARRLGCRQVSFYRWLQRAGFSWPPNTPRGHRQAR